MDETERKMIVDALRRLYEESEAFTREHNDGKVNYPYMIGVLETIIEFLAKEIESGQIGTGYQFRKLLRENEK